MFRRSFTRGDPIVYRMQKHSRRPGPRAKDVRAAPRGDTYCYSVDKFWVVADARPDGKLLLCTRGGKRHVVDGQSSRIRRPTLWERVAYRHRFPQLADIFG